MMQAASVAKKLVLGKKRQTKTARDVSFFAYLPALTVALLKDLLDFTFITLIPGLGTILTWLMIGLITMLLSLAGTRHASQSIKFILLGASAVVEGLLLGVNLLPITTLTVLAIYHLEKTKGYVFKA